MKVNQKKLGRVRQNWTAKGPKSPKKLLEVKKSRMTYQSRKKKSQLKTHQNRHLARRRLMGWKLPVTRIVGQLRSLLM